MTTMPPTTLPPTTVANQCTDFSEYTTGVIPSDWTESWTSGSGSTGEWEVSESLTEKCGTKSLWYNDIDGLSSRIALSWDDAGNFVGDCEILGLFYLGAVGANIQAAIVLRGGGGPPINFTGYSVQINNGDLDIRDCDASQTQYDTYNSNWSAGQWVWIRARIDGYRIRARSWEFGDAEPTGSWQVDWTDGSTKYASGWIGLWGCDVDYYCDIFCYDVTAGTIADPACMLVITTGPATTLAPSSIPPTSAPPSSAPPTSAPPTSAPPTTIVPTSAPPTTVPPTFATTSPPTTAPPTEPPPDEIVIVTDTVIRLDPIEVLVSIHGEQFNQCFEVDPLEATVGIIGSVVVGHVIDAGPIEVEVSIEASGAVLGDYGSHWAKWSKIGYLDFAIEEDNMAGERPMDWKGQIYDIKVLGKLNVVYYGQNGVTILRPRGVHMDMETIYDLGVMNKGAVAGNYLNHFFIDVLGQLWQLGTNVRRTAFSKAEGMIKLDYSEFLSQMSNPIMSYDVEKGLLYICDGTLGYIYSINSGSFGEGPVNITGMGSQGGTLYVAADDEIETPKFDICTDIYDFGTRKFKTIQFIEVGSDLTEHLNASVEYRTSNKEDFRQIGWFLVNPNGRAYPKCYGVEFRFRLRSFMYEYLELDYLKIRGHIHGFSYLDTTVERPGVAV